MNTPKNPNSPQTNKKPAGKGRPASAGPTLSVEQSRAKITPARRAAFEILTLVGEGKGHSDELLHGVRTEALSLEDKHLATALVMGVLRWQIELDARIIPFLEHPDKQVADPVVLALRFGTFQLLHMDRIPAHAALSESVEMCRAGGHPYATGMVNAILRKIAAAQPPGKRVFESTAAFAERLGHPQWLAERWVAIYGREAALKICEAGQTEPTAGGLFGTPTDDETNAQAGAAGGRLPRMDDGSRLIAELVAASAPAVSGRPLKVWDTCAAPGGKTLMLAVRLPTAEILATDVSPKRMGQMEARLRRYPYAANIKCQVADASLVPEQEGDFDLILCDAPCSGTGTLARNPEIRHHLEPADLARQATRQRILLEAGLKRLAPGGRLVYSTCSLEPEENEAILASLPPAIRPVPVAPLLENIPGLRTDAASVLRDGVLRTLPGVHPCDGFFAAVLERPS